MFFDVYIYVMLFKSTLLDFKLNLNEYLIFHWITEKINVVESSQEILHKEKQNRNPYFRSWIQF